ncbi:O-methyltransferase [Gottfriedia solisilvae]|uniref:tRNA 5-hydroxyuridine methyltransferase n=1 Tax=Gottfriedia solisilvae TaxID=1516104 RepID=A0A8J3ACF3_9BACI|nr:O-methyltransferase [Gottfriedia solisilvae]GGI10624.1 SAM-dependent methyltransferase [Gottfriedia solisilvae]
MDEVLVRQYLANFYKHREPFIEEMEMYAKEQHVPIMDKAGMEFMLGLLYLIQPTSILEIGSAIGYSSIRMAKSFPELRIVTMERNAGRIRKAKEYIDRSGYSNRITLLEGDALLLKDHLPDNRQFDVIFIDAAKAQYQRFFELYEPLLSERGVIISDNVLFKGQVAESAELVDDRRKRALIKRIQNYNEWLMNHPMYDSTIIPIGDGVAISKKRGVNNVQA